MLAAPKRLGSARVLACNFRRPAGKLCSARRRTPHAGTRYAPQTYPETVASQRAFRKRFARDALADELFGAVCQAAAKNDRYLAQAPPQDFRIYRSGQVSAAGSSGQVCARLFKALLQRLGVTGNAHQR
jgi:hypothetical protein